MCYKGKGGPDNNLHLLTHTSLHGFRDGGAYSELRGGAYKGAPEVLTCRGSGNICEIIILCIFSLKLRGAKAPQPTGSPSLG